MIELVESGIVYRNPRPHLKSIHAWHPSIVLTSDGDLVSTFDLGEAGESLDYHTRITRSTDGGRTWSEPVPLLPPEWPLRPTQTLPHEPSSHQSSPPEPSPPKPSPPALVPQEPSPRRSTHTVRIASMGDGELVGWGARFYRDDPDEGLVNRANLGYVPMDLFLIRSCDEGLSWSSPEWVTPPLVGPAFEMCHRIVELKDGRWLAPTSTWKGWNGEAPHGMQAIALVSYDRGRSWPDYLSIADQWSEGTISWEQGLTQLHDGRLLAVVWSFHEPSGISLPNRYTLSEDGRTFAPLRENGMRGETAKLITLPDGKVLCLYRRHDRPGLWAALVQIEADDWLQLEEFPLWQGQASGMVGHRRPGDELGALKFGFPSMLQLPDGHVFAVFWCLEEGLHVIRWLKLAIH